MIFPFTFKLPPAILVVPADVNVLLFTNGWLMFKVPDNKFKLPELLYPFAVPAMVARTLTVQPLILITAAEAVVNILFTVKVLAFTIKPPKPFKVKSLVAPFASKVT